MRGEGHAHYVSLHLIGGEEVIAFTAEASCVRSLFQNGNG